MNGFAGEMKFTTRLVEGVRKYLKAGYAVQNPIEMMRKLQRYYARTLVGRARLSLKMELTQLVLASLGFDQTLTNPFTCTVTYHGTTHSSLRVFPDNAFPTGFSPLLLRVQQPFVSQSGATTSHNGLRVPYLPKCRRDRGQRLGISE